MMYGHHDSVELLKRDMLAQKFPLMMTKDGVTKMIWTQGSLRFLPGGLFEYVFPKECLNMVLAHMGAHTDPRADYMKQDIRIAGLKIKPFNYVRKMFKLKDMPKDIEPNKVLNLKVGEERVLFELAWMSANVTLVPIGIKEDETRVGEQEPYVGWSFEML